MSRDGNRCWSCVGKNICDATKATRWIPGKTLPDALHVIHITETVWLKLVLSVCCVTYSPGIVDERLGGCARVADPGLLRPV